LKQVGGGSSPWAHLFALRSKAALAQTWIQSFLF
jgi:hypothetical protein